MWYNISLDKQQRTQNNNGGKVCYLQFDEDDNKMSYKYIVKRTENYVGK